MSAATHDHEWNPFDSVSSICDGGDAPCGVVIPTAPDERVPPKAPRPMDANGAPLYVGDTISHRRTGDMRQITRIRKGQATWVLTPRGEVAGQNYILMPRTRKQRVIGMSYVRPQVVRAWLGGRDYDWVVVWGGQVLKVQPGRDSRAECMARVFDDRPPLMLRHHGNWDLA